jgi:excisionase family DNA binding protein
MVTSRMALLNSGLHPQNERELLDFYLSLASDERKLQFAPTAEAANNFGISQRTLQRWIEEGSILAIRAGGKYQVYLPAVERYIAGCSHDLVSKNVRRPLRPSR